MNSMLPAYLRRRVGTQILMLLVGITALMQVLELLDVTTDVLKRGQGLSGLLYYGMLRTPAELVLALPLAVLLGTMMVFHSMARGLEITAIRTAGVSLMRLLGYLAPLLLLLAIFQFALSERVLPRAETELTQWWNASAPPDTEQTRLWARTSSGPVSIEAISPDGRRLRDVRIYARDKSGLITARLSAQQAVWDGRAWQLTNVQELGVTGATVQRLHSDSRAWATNLRPDDVLRLALARPHLSSTMLAEVIAGARAGTQPRSYYQTVLYRSFTAPLGIFVMALLALPTACSLPRVTGGREMLVALVLGLSFLLSDGIIVSLGTSGRLPPLVVALAAPLLFAFIGMLQLRAYERI
jgi:lipopolysaccharide export system permease protein